MIPSLSIHQDAAQDLRQLMVSDPEAAGKILALLEQAKLDSKILETMLQHNEFFKPTATLALPVTKVGDAAIGVSATTAPMILCFEVSLQTLPSAPAAVNIDDLVTEFESQSEAHAKAMRQGRKWVGETFYKDRPNLAQMRLNKGWSQLQLAQKAATSQSYIARLEQGKIDPQLSTMKKIADALDVSLETLAAALLQEVKR